LVTGAEELARFLLIEADRTSRVSADLGVADETLRGPSLAPRGIFVFTFVEPDDDRL
jgi:hypothetical protein